MRKKFVPPPSPEDQSDERLMKAVDSAIDVIQQRFANLAEDTQQAKYSVSDLVKLLQLRTQLRAERPRTINVRWIDERDDAQ